MDRLLDKDIHQLYKTQSATNYLSNLAPSGNGGSSSSSSSSGANKQSTSASAASTSRGLGTMGEVRPTFNDTVLIVAQILVKVHSCTNRR
jgi:hypothetical protein